jgi:YggT family protein
VSIATSLISLLFNIMTFLILIDVIGSWIVSARVQLPNWAYDILSTVRSIVAPILDPVRRVLPTLGGLDFSPIVALFLLDLVRRLILSALYGLG